jgi:hypothetical protein
MLRLTVRQSSKFKFKLIYDRQSVSQSVLVPGTHLRPVTNFFSLLKVFFRNLTSLLLCSTLSDERAGPVRNSSYC